MGQGEAGGRAARQELPDTRASHTAGSNWLVHESPPLPPPTQPLLLLPQLKTEKERLLN